MTRAAIAAAVPALVWAGVTIGGSLIAAPAKFGAPSLDLPTALEVGRAQFFWVGIAEGALCAALVGAFVFRPPVARWWLAAPVLLGPRCPSGARTAGS